MPGQHSQPSLTSLGQVCACSGVTCHLHFCQNDWGLLHATAVTCDERAPNKSQHRRLTLEMKTLLPGLKLQPLDHESGTLPASHPSSPSSVVTGVLQLGLKRSEPLGQGHFFYIQKP